MDWVQFFCLVVIAGLLALLVLLFMVKLALMARALERLENQQHATLMVLGKIATKLRTGAWPE